MGQMRFVLDSLPILMYSARDEISVQPRPGNMVVHAKGDDHRELPQ